MYPQITLQTGREKSVFFRHPWIFSRALDKVPSNLENGSLVDVFAAGGQLLGTGYYNEFSQIAVRIISFFEKVKVDAAFFEQKFRMLDAERKEFLDWNKTNAYRLVFAESDGLPGLIVDRYDQFLVIQIHTLGMNQLRNLIVEALVKVFQPEGIYERSDLEVRRKEGLKDLPTGVLYGSEPLDFYEIRENGFKFFVDIKRGQKTGFFLDQRENRKALASYAEGKTVLNLFCYSGAFSVAALAGKASTVFNVDISETALAIAKENFVLNGFSPEEHFFIKQDVFAYLNEMIEQKKTFDLAIVDPPAFVKNKESLPNAINAYIQLNEKALRVLKSGGIFVSSSCSSYVSQEMFRTILFKAALKAHADLTILESKLQPFDHPLRINFPEGEYLKFFVCRKS